MKRAPHDLDTLKRTLAFCDGRPANTCSELAGEYDYEDFILVVEQIPDEPGRQPVRVRARVKRDVARFPRDVFNTRSREVAARDFIARALGYAAARFQGTPSEKRTTRIHIDRPGRELLETTAVVAGDSDIEARFSFDLPVRKDRIMGNATAELFMKVIPRVVREGLIFKNLDGEGLADWIEANEDADAARAMLAERGLVAFIADGAVLPGKKEDTPRTPFRSPEEFAVTLELPNAETVRGMGVPKGITLVIGPFGSGKSTLLRALEFGVYNHVPGDGREMAVTVGDAVGLRTEEGRRVEQTDISLVFAPSPGNDTKRFSSRFAGVSASQAANLSEALEIGTSLLIIDEDTSAADIMTRDERMQALVPPDTDPEAALVDILPVLRDRGGISAVIAASSGDYLDIADTVIRMDRFLPSSAASEAERIRKEFPSKRKGRALEYSKPLSRCPLAISLEPEKSVSRERSFYPGRGFIQYGDEYVDCSKVTQLVSPSQERAISRAMSLVRRLMEGSNSLAEAVEKVMQRVNTVGLDTLSSRLTGDLASFRAHELAAAVNRLKRLKVK